MITATKSEVESMGEQLKRIQAQAFEQGRQAGIKEAVEIVKGFLPDENERIRNWDLDQIGNNIEEIIEALLKEVK